MRQVKMCGKFFQWSQKGHSIPGKGRSRQISARIGALHKSENRVSRLSQIQRVRQVEGQDFLLWQEISPLLLSSFVTSRSILLTCTTHLPQFLTSLNPTSEPNSTATSQAFVIPWNCYISEITKKLQFSPSPFCLSLNLFNLTKIQLVTSIPIFFKKILLLTLL